MEENRTPLPPPEKHVYTLPEKLALAFAFALGIIVCWIWFGENSDYLTHELRRFIPVYALFWGVYAAGFCLFNRDRAKHPASLFLLAAAALLFLRYGVYRQAETSLLNLLVIPLILMLHAVDVAFDVPACREGQYIALYLRGWFGAPFLCIGRFFGAIAALFPRGKADEKTKAVRIGILAALPIAAVAALLLIRADAAMSYYLSRFLDGLSFGDTLTRLIFTCIIAVVFYSFYYAMTWKKPRISDAPYPKPLEGLTAATVLTVLLALYGVFAAFQFSYLTGLAGLPEELTYSEYAVQGFGELCAVAGINFTVFALLQAFTKEHKALRPMLLALLAATALLLVSALYRLILYIDAYGLTFKRILSLWFMGFLLIALGLFAGKLYRPKLKLIRTLAMALVLWYLALSAINIDAVIAKSVLAEAAKTGTLRESDANYLRYQLSADAKKVLLESPMKEEIYYDVDIEDLP
ncbi:MAG: DUF4173 domain-containing protein [Clostridiales bacterium]|nr:DUF4173 domain-containing protein [Clostridiales bacterium]